MPDGSGRLVAKRLDSPYRSGRVETWLKLKCSKSDSFPIVAFVEKLEASSAASLYLGRRDGGRILYAGKARTGYTPRRWLSAQARLSLSRRRRS